MPRSLRPLAALVGALALAITAACGSSAGDATGPVAAAPRPFFQGGSGGGGSDTSTTSGGGQTGGGQNGGSGGTYVSCGILSANIQTYNIVVYTTRIGIGFSGTATNCGTKNESFEVTVMDIETDPVCHVDVPHFIAAKNASPGEVQSWSANSTLVNCQSRTHTFNLTLIDTRTNQVLATKQVSAFL